MKAPHFMDHPALRVEPTLGAAVARTVETWMPSFKHLPVPVRFRASGALSAWQNALAELPNAAAAREALASPSTSLADARRQLGRALEPHIHIRPGAEHALSPMLHTLLTISTDMLCFWLRRGALYEPTPALGTLLGGSDISTELPLQFVAPPSAALCIIPPWQQRHRCANANAILVFEHDAAAVQAPARRAVTMLACRPSPEGIMTDELVLPIKDESEALVRAFERASAASASKAGASGYADTQELQGAKAEWKDVLDYVVKVLLYLELDNAAVRELTPYSAAPKEFPGLGRRKREAKLALVEQLYDRYIVGPDTLLDMGLAGFDERVSKGQHQVSAHWRRGHFRAQPHGPQASLRKVMFIAPTVVRADKLPAAAA